MVRRVGTDELIVSFLVGGILDARGLGGRHGGPLNRVKQEGGRPLLGRRRRHEKGIQRLAPLREGGKCGLDERGRRIPNLVAGPRWEVLRKRGHELTQRKVEVARQGIGHRVGRPGDVVVTRHISVEALVRTEHAEEVRGDLVRRGAPLPLPEEGVEVVRLAERGALPDIERLGKGLEMEQAASQLQVRVGDGALGVGFGDKKVCNSLGPAQSPHQGLVRGALAGDQVLGREPDPPCTGTRCIVMAFCGGK